MSAETDCQNDDENCTPIGEWQLGVSVGLGARTNPIIDNDDIPLILLPSISYYGEKFFIENLDVGYTLIDSEKLMLNALVTPSYDRVFFERWDLGNLLDDFSSPSAGDGATSGFEPGEPTGPTLAENVELKSRKFSLLGGLELSGEIGTGQIQVSVLNDLSDVHSGQEVRFAYAQPISQSDWNLTLGFTWKDADMTDYYYGVDADEANASRNAYQADASLNPFIRINWRQSNQKDSFWRFGIEYQKLDSSIGDSPLVDKDYVITAFVGKQYNF